MNSIEEIVKAFVALPPKDRIEAITRIGAKVCLECGCDEPEDGPYCQCSNDE